MWFGLRGLTLWVAKALYSDSQIKKAASLSCELCGRLYRCSSRIVSSLGMFGLSSVNRRVVRVRRIVGQIISSKGSVQEERF